MNKGQWCRAFGKLVKQKRMELDLTQSALAGLCGTTRNTVINAETGNHLVNIHVGVSLMKILKIDFGELSAMIPSEDLKQYTRDVTLKKIAQLEQQLKDLE